MEGSTGLVNRAEQRRLARDADRRKTGGRGITYSGGQRAWVPMDSIPVELRTAGARYTFPPFTALNEDGLTQCAILLGLRGQIERRAMIARIDRNLAEWSTE